MKIAVLGYAGSGKTYLSDCLSEKKNIPVLHLDDIKWDKEWKLLCNVLLVLFNVIRKRMQVSVIPSGAVFINDIRKLTVKLRE